MILNISISFKIMTNYRINITRIHKHSILQDYSVFTQTFYRRHIMAHKQHRPSFAPTHILHLANSLLLEFSITDSKHLINHKDFWL